MCRLFWRTIPTKAYHPILISGAASAIADIDNNGKPEIIVGSAVFNGKDGSVKWAPPYRTGSYGRYNRFLDGLATAIDLDLDGKQEILAGNTAFNSDGTTKWWNTNFGDGVNVIVHFDDDPYPEIVFVTHDSTNQGGMIYLLDHNGKVKWGPVTMKSLEPVQPQPGSTWYGDIPWGSVPVIADFDGDGIPEIRMKGVDHFFILDKNGHLKQTLSTPHYYYFGMIPLPRYLT